MVSNEDVCADKNKKASFKEVRGVKSWLLKKAKTFMWDAASNTFILPQGVVLSKEEREALEEVIGEIKEEAVAFDRRRQLEIMAVYKAGIQFKKDIVKGYDLLLNGSYREVTGILAQKIHTNLQGMLLINKRFLEGVWKVIASVVKGNSEERKPKSGILLKKRDGR